MQKVSIPQHIDDQQQFFFWEMDEASIVISFIFLGMLFRTLLTMMLVSIVVQQIFTRFKYSQMPGILMHMGYRVGLTRLNKKFNNGLVRHFHS